MRAPDTAQPASIGDCSSHPALRGLTVLERGWLSSNNLLIHAAAGEPGAVLIDTSHANHAAQTVSLVRHALQGERLNRVLNTHLHSDHCGGNAALAAAFAAPLWVPPGQAEAVRAWDEPRLSHGSTGQRCERFEIAGTLAPGAVLRAGGRAWQVLAAPGHDPHSVMFFDADQGVLVSADALWENGFGIVFPEIEGEPGFDDVAQVLDAIERLPVSVVVPGHGRPFSDVPAALARARSRLLGFQRQPQRHARHALKVLLKYHLMEEREQPREALLTWAESAPLLQHLWQRHAPTDLTAPGEWIAQLLQEMVQQGLAVERDGLVVDA